MVGVTGDKKLAVQIKKEICEFLNNKLLLELNKEKTKITHLKSQRARFLGVDIRVPYSTMGKTITRKMKDGRKIISRTNQVRISFEAPMKEIYTKLLETGFVKQGYNNKEIDKGLIPNAMTR